MKMINKAIFVGRLTKDPEMRYTKNGKAVTSFSIAVSEKFKDQETTEFIDCVTWNKLAEICGEYLKKGALVYVEGKHKTERWETDKGEKRSKVVYTIFDMKMLGSKNGK